MSLVLLLGRLILSMFLHPPLKLLFLSGGPHIALGSLTDDFEYRIARNFRGLKFSRMSLAQTFRDLIFEDCVRATYVNRRCKILEDKIFEVRH